MNNKASSKSGKRFWLPRFFCEFYATFSHLLLQNWCVLLKKHSVILIQFSPRHVVAYYPAAEMQMLYGQSIK